MGWKTLIIGAESTISLSSNRLKISIGQDAHFIPIGDIDTIVLSNRRLAITMALLSRLIEENITIIVCNEINDPVGTFMHFNGHHQTFHQIQNQTNWKLIRKKQLWKTIIQQKIQSEIDCLKLLGIEKNIPILTSYKQSVQSDDKSNREGSSARIYFTSLFGSEFTRDTACLQNAALNYGYKILASYISNLICSRGYLPQVGIHHIGASNDYNLTYDLIEPFRAIIDLWVYCTIDNQFTGQEKQGLIELLDAHIYLQDKKYRLRDAIIKIIDSDFAYLNEQSDQILKIQLSKGIDFV